MGGMIAPPSPYPTAIPNPINPNTPGFNISAFFVVSTTQVILYFSNNLRVGDTIVFGGLRTLTGLNGQQVTIVATNPGGASLAAFQPTASGLGIINPGTIPGGLTGTVTEIGVVTRLTSAPRQSAPYYTDPAAYGPPADGSGPLIVTRTLTSVAHPGRQIPDQVIGSMTRISRVTLTSSQLLNLNTTPLQILPEPGFVPSGLQGTPGPGLAFSVKLAHFKFSAGTAPYTAGAVSLYLGPVANGIVLAAVPAGLLTATVDTDYLNAAISPVTAQAAGLIENQPVVVSAPTAAVGGNGMLTVILEYTVVQT